MIVTPDMPDHWKTRLLVDLLGGDELAPVYLIRLWGHCQNQKKCEFDALPPAAIKAICRFSGDAAQIDAAMVEAGFLEREGKSAIISGWDEHNASLINSWVNGQKGGRPKKPKETGKESTETHGLPNTNPSESDREDRGEKIDKTDKKNPPPKAKLSAQDIASRFGISHQKAAEFAQIRKDKRLTNTPTAMDTLEKEFQKAQLSNPDGIDLCLSRSWGAFKASWDWRDGNSNQNNGGGRPSHKPFEL